MAPATKDAKKGKTQVDPLLDLAQKLRTTNKLEVRDAVCEGQRYDFFRGKDLFRLIKEDESFLDGFPKLRASGRPIEEQTTEVLQTLLLQGYIFRTERLQKVPKPGKKLLKFPKKLETAREQRFVEDGFYAWRYKLPTHWTTYLGSALVVMFTIGCCLFPLSPHWVKLGVLYTCLFLLGLIFFVAIVRWAVYGVTWIFLGRYFWICPNLFSDDVGVLEAFVPFFDISPIPGPGEEDQGPKRENRAVVGLLVAATLYWMFQTAPDGDEMRAKAHRTHKSILEMLDLYQPNKFLDDLTNVTTPNVTEYPKREAPAEDASKDPLIEEMVQDEEEMPLPEEAEAPHPEEIKAEL